MYYITFMYFLFNQSICRTKFEYPKAPVRSMPLKAFHVGKSIDGLSESQLQLYRLLMNKRSELASMVDCMPYMIASNETLMKMSKLMPKSLQELRNSDCK